MKGKNKPFAFRGLYLLSFVVVVYGSVFFFNAQVAGLAIGKSWVVLRKILPILAFVVFFTTLLNFFLRPKEGHRLCLIKEIRLERKIYQACLEC